MSEWPPEEARHVRDCGLPLWNLSQDDHPELLLEYFEWLTKPGNDKAFESAVDSMQQVGVGFNALHIKRMNSPSTGKMTDSLQLNFYCEAVGGSGEENPHTHSRTAHSAWYSTGAKQQISTWWLKDRAPLADYDTEHKPVDVVANAIIDSGDGKLPEYYPKKIGEGVLWLLGREKLAPLSSKTFTNREIHAVSVDWKRDSTHRKNARLGQVAVSAHRKGMEPEPHYNHSLRYTWDWNRYPFKYLRITMDEFLMDSHGLTSQQVYEASNLVRELMRKHNRNGDVQDPRSQLITMVYPPHGSSIEHLKGKPKATDPETAKDLILGGKETLQALV